MWKNILIIALMMFLSGCLWPGSGGTPAVTSPAASNETSAAVNLPGGSGSEEGDCSRYEGTLKEDCENNLKLAQMATNKDWKACEELSGNDLQMQCMQSIFMELILAQGDSLTKDFCATYQAEENAFEVCANALASVLEASGTKDPGFPSADVLDEKICNALVDETKKNLCLLSLMVESAISKNDLTVCGGLSGNWVVDCQKAVIRDKVIESRSNAYCAELPEGELKTYCGTEAESILKNLEEKEKIYQTLE